MIADRGVIYYATGPTFLEEAMVSARSLKEYNDLNITLYTDQDGVDSPLFDSTIQIESGDYPFYDRMTYFKSSPYAKTLYLDTDTIVSGSIEPIFDTLDRFDIVAAINETRDTTAEHTRFLSPDLDVPECFPELQCGVIGFTDNPSVMTVFNDWQSRYKNYRDELILDQPFFREAVYNNEVKLGILPPEYNFMANFCGYAQGKVHIFHFGGRRKNEVDIPLQKDRERSDVVDVINRDVENKRVFYYDDLNQLKVRPKNPTPKFIRFIGSLSRNGLIGTVNRIIQELPSYE